MKHMSGWILFLSTHVLTFSLTFSSPYAAFERFEYTGEAVTAPSDLPSGFYRNPILAGFHPDPSLCRVDNDYYLINSTFEYFPGLPIFHSTDLVNWEQIGHVIHRPEQLDYKGRRVSNGLFAPAISYHDGKFYVVCTMVDGFGNFVVTAENPAGPWSDPISVGFQGIDPSLFFDDDGRAWIVNNDAPQGPPQYEGHRAIWIQEFDPETNKMVGPRKMIVNGGIDISQKPIWIEGPHIYKRNNWYYLCCAEGGTSTNHSQVILRSKKVDGPYVPWDKNPILTQRNLDGNVPGAVTCTGHADLEIGPDGNWWAVFLAVRPYEGGFSPMGRETFLLPVTWTDDEWPVILPPGQRVPLVEKAPNDAVVRASGSTPLNGSFTWRDDFREKDLSLEWIMLREPDKQWWKVDSQAGKLKLSPQSEKLSGSGNPSYLGRRVRHAVYTAALTVEVPEEPGVSAGMALFMNERHHYFLAVHRSDNQARIYLERVQGGRVNQIAAADLPSVTDVDLRIETRKNTCSFRYKIKDNWETLLDDADATLISYTVPDGMFLGATVGPHVRIDDEPVRQTKEDISLLAARQAQNPIIWADVPDVAVIRVGDTYYMSSTTMHMSPGLPIMKSKDLVNWNLIGYAYDRLVENDAMNLENGRNCYGAGSWASSLRYHNGTYYATTFSSTSGRTHVYRTRDIEKGDWKASSFSPSLHDHTLFFDDDGRVYMIYGAGKLTLVELLEDLSGIKPDGVNKVIIENANLLFGENEVGGLNGEGSQLIKVNGRYYLLNIASPRSRWSRSVLIHRADSIAGPWEGRVALEDKGVAQGCLIDTPDGKWYAMLFQDNGSVGRSPWLVPVKWEDGWPVFGIDGKAPETIDIEDNETLLDSNIVTSDEFDRKPGDVLPPAWQWNHNPDNSNWSVGEREGHLRITTGRVDNSILSARNILTQRTFGPVSSASTKVDVTNMKDGDYAGLIALQQRFGAVCVKMENGTKSIVMMGIGSQPSDRRGRGSRSNPPVEIESVPLTQPIVYFKIDCDFRNRTDKAYFYYSLDNKNWIKIGSVLQMSYTMPHFMGYRFGLFNYAAKTAGGYVDFDYYRVTNEITIAD